MTPASATEFLRVVNARLRVALDRFRPERHSCLAVQPEELSSLMAELMQAGECLCEMSGELLPAELERQRSIYRDNLIELERLLPDFYRRLSDEKSRLFELQKHLDCAAAWAGRNQNM